MIKDTKEIAYLYDLYLVPTWRNHFDTLFDEKCGIPQTGHVLDINCGTGGHAIELAKHLTGKGNVTAIDDSLEIIKLAQAKATIAKLDNLNFWAANTLFLAFADNSFDMVITDVSLAAADKLAKQLPELIRVAKPGAKIVVYDITRGSFDEFFSVFWEALYNCQLSEKLFSNLEALINERATILELEQLLKESGLKSITSYIEKTEFLFETAEAFFQSPLIEHFMLEKWFSIVPKNSVKAVNEALTSIIDTERNGYDFDISIKATLLVAEKHA
ncbi:MAG: class I SAM-dependent methyltransferase [Blastocatellia bacterium]|nr:class I SAM-dependent methyltransferase [Blastocatellia bacterium]MBL8196894.1 class I SAM-dependent methyltransferase [Blastocatellia bacterium]